MIDGEAVILDERGRSSVAELQADLDRHGSERAVLYAFDLLFLDGEPLWKKPLEERRLALASVIPKRSAILLSEDHSGPGADLFRIACEHETPANWHLGMASASSRRSESRCWPSNSWKSPGDTGLVSLSTLRATASRPAADGMVRCTIMVPAG